METSPCSRRPSPCARHSDSHLQHISGTADILQLKAPKINSPILLRRASLQPVPGVAHGGLISCIQHQTLMKQQQMAS